MIKSSDITRTQFTVADFVSWMRNRELDLSPSFQRRPVWKLSAKSYLVDTIIRGLPTPIIFLRQITDTKKLSTVRQVVDGQQRIRTLLSFVDKTLLKDWKSDRDEFTVSKAHNSEIAGQKFQALDKVYKERILNYQFSTHVLPTDTSDQQVLDIFRRMNATGTKLNSQELRNAEFFGEFIQSVYATALASLDLWRRWGVFTEDNIARMNEVEFVSELYIMMLSGPSEKSQTEINNYYRDYDETFAERANVEKRLNALLTEINDTSGEVLSTSPLSNRIVLYALISALYEKSYGSGSSLVKNIAKKSVPALAKKLAKLSQRLEQDSRAALPQDVQDALISRSGRKANREALVKFIAKGIS